MWSSSMIGMLKKNFNSFLTIATCIWILSKVLARLMPFLVLILSASLFSSECESANGETVLLASFTKMLAYLMRVDIWTAWTCLACALRSCSQAIASVAMCIPSRWISSVSI